MAKISCPHCGALVDSSRSVCPHCRAVIQKKSSLTPYLIAAGIIGLLILVVVVLLLLPPPQPAPQPAAPRLTVPPTAAAVQAASPPCTIAITGKKNPPAKIQLQVMTSTCFAGDITELRVSVNGAQKGTLGSGPGSSGTFDGTSGSNNVVVSAKFSNGAESVVYQNGAL
jgi:hypothetical protein